MDAGVGGPPLPLPLPARYPPLQAPLPAAKGGSSTAAHLEHSVLFDHQHQLRVCFVSPVAADARHVSRNRHAAAACGAVGGGAWGAGVWA